MTIGEQLRTIRENKGLPLREVAAEIGVDISLLGKIERDERQPTKKQIKNIASFFIIEEKVLIVKTMSKQVAYKLANEKYAKEILVAAEKEIQYLINLNGK
jgi:transcriptional regulator with XRE-family HTH domain